jgi:hypothetical protein
MDDDKPDPHCIAYFHMLKGVRDGYEEAHSADENYCHEAFAYALIWLLIDHIRDHREADRPEMVTHYKAELDQAMWPDDEYVPPMGTRH